MILIAQKYQQKLLSSHKPEIKFSNKQDFIRKKIYFDQQQKNLIKTSKELYNLIKIKMQLRISYYKSSAFNQTLECIFMQSIPNIY